MDIEKKIRRKIGEAVVSQNLIQNNDKILVAISGGKDSWVLLHFLHILSKHSPNKFTLMPYILDIGYDLDYIFEIKNKINSDYSLELKIEKINMLDILENEKAEIKKSKSPCMLCSRIRRGRIYKFANSNNCTKIALGHHADDLIETFLLNFIFLGEIKTMAPRIIADNGENIVIRPLYKVLEKEIIEYIDKHNFPIKKPNCPYEKEKSKRYEMKKIIENFCKLNPQFYYSALAAFENVNISHLIDRRYIDINKNMI